MIFRTFVWRSLAFFGGMLFAYDMSRLGYPLHIKTFLLGLAGLCFCCLVINLAVFLLDRDHAGN